MAKSPTPLGWTTCAAQGTRPPSLIVLMSLSMIVILAKGLESSATILVGLQSFLDNGLAVFSDALAFFALIIVTYRLTDRN